MCTSVLGWGRVWRVCLSNEPPVRAFVQLRNCRLYGRQNTSTQEQTTSQARRIPITKAEQMSLSRKKPVQPPDPHMLKVAIIGPPNAGKSTLANQLLGWRFSAVSKKVHTTRNNSVGVLTEGNSQVVFLDTPGLTTSEKVRKHNLERTLLTDPYSSLFEADLILAVVDVSKVWNRSRLDNDVLTALTLHSNKRSALVLNKVDEVAVKSDLLTCTRILSCGHIGGVDVHSTASIPEVRARDYQRLVDNMEQRLGQSEADPVGEGTSDRDAEDEVDSRGQLGHVGGEEESMDLESKWWKEYNRRLRRARKETAKLRGWDKFDRVFMISALHDDGVEEIKDYLLDMARPADWKYDRSLITDQDPKELARMCVWEKLLDHLPDEIPYEIIVKNTGWHIDEENSLRTSFDLICSRKRHTVHLLKNKGAILKKIALEAKQELMNTFRMEMTLYLVVRTTAKSKPR